MKEKKPVNTYTRATGARENNDDKSLTTGNGFTALADTLLIEKLSHFNRERIPERVVHAKGFGAHGVFETTNDLTRYTCARIFDRVGKTCPVLMRMSTVGGGQGSADTARDPRGFAVRFYTEDGNLDIVGNATPVFFINDPIKFPDFIHSQKFDPVTNLVNYNSFWDFLSLSPESIHQATRLMSDYGTPYGFRHMDGFGTNTLGWYNTNGERYFVKFHFKTEQGVKNMTDAEATKMAGVNPNFSGDDLYGAIDRAEYPSWRVMVQIMTPEEAARYRFDPFDTTLIWYEEDYPLIPLGRITLNKKPENFFEEVEQAAFCPANMVTGFMPTQDKMLQGRMFAYRDTQLHRLGANFMNLPINRPKTPVFNYQQNGYFANNNAGSINYYPNSYDRVSFSEAAKFPPMPAGGAIERYVKPAGGEVFEQAGRFYRELSEKEKTNLISNIAGHLGKAEKRLQYRQTALFYKADPEYGTRVADALNLNLSQVQKMSVMTQEARVKMTN